MAEVSYGVNLFIAWAIEILLSHIRENLQSNNAHDQTILHVSRGLDVIVEHCCCPRLFITMAHVHAYFIMPSGVINGIIKFNRFFNALK